MLRELSCGATAPFTLSDFLGYFGTVSALNRYQAERIRKGGNDGQGIDASRK
jgi:hypothetical protein